LPRLTKFGCLIALVGLAYCCSEALAADKPQVRWLVIDFPPFHIVSGPDRGKGMRDRYLDALRARLPNFDSRVEVSDTTRQVALMQAGQPVCSISMLRTPEREQFMLFSEQPYGLQLPVRLVMASQSAAALGPVVDDQGVDLARVLAGGMIRLGVLPKRRFGASIDRVIADAAVHYPNTVQVFNANGSLEGLLDLIGKGRIEATLGYGLEVEQLRQHNAKLGDFAFLPITQAPDLVPTYVACSRNPVGAKVIAEINALGFNDAATRQLRADYEALLPTSERKEFEHALAGK